MAVVQVLDPQGMEFLVAVLDMMEDMEVILVLVMEVQDMEA